MAENNETSVKKNNNAASQTNDAVSAAKRAEEASRPGSKVKPPKASEGFTTFEDAYNYQKAKRAEQDKMFPGVVARMLRRKASDQPMALPVDSVKEVANEEQSKSNIQNAKNADENAKEGKAPLTSVETQPAKTNAPGGKDKIQKSSKQKEEEYNTIISKYSPEQLNREANGQKFLDLIKGTLDNFSTSDESIEEIGKIIQASYDHDYKTDAEIKYEFDQKNAQKIKGEDKEEQKSINTSMIDLNEKKRENDSRAAELYGYDKNNPPVKTDTSKEEDKKAEQFDYTRDKIQPKDYSKYDFSDNETAQNLFSKVNKLYTSGKYNKEAHTNAIESISEAIKNGNIDVGDAEKLIKYIKYANSDTQNVQKNKKLDLSEVTVDSFNDDKSKKLFDSISSANTMSDLTNIEKQLSSGKLKIGNADSVLLNRLVGDKIRNKLSENRKNYDSVVNWLDNPNTQKKYSQEFLDIVRNNLGDSISGIDQRAYDFVKSLYEKYNGAKSEPVVKGSVVKEPIKTEQFDYSKDKIQPKDYSAYTFTKGSKARALFEMASAEQNEGRFSSGFYNSAIGAINKYIASGEMNDSDAIKLMKFLNYTQQKHKNLEGLDDWLYYASQEENAGEYSPEFINQIRDEVAKAQKKGLEQNPKDFIESRLKKYNESKQQEIEKQETPSKKVKVATTRKQENWDRANKILNSPNTQLPQRFVNIANEQLESLKEEGISADPEKFLNNLYDYYKMYRDKHPFQRQITLEDVFRKKNMNK